MSVKPSPRRFGRAARPMLAVGVVAATALLSACGSTDSVGAADPAALQKKTIGISFPNYSIQAGPTLEIETAKKKAAEMGYKLLIDDPKDDQGAQVGTIDTWIQQGVGTIIAGGGSTEGLESTAKKARAKGIKWVTYAGKITNQDATLGFDHVQGGEQIGTAACEFADANLGGKGEAAILTFETGDWARTRKSGILKGLEKCPGVKIVAEQDALSKTEGAETIGPIMRAHPNVNIVLAILEDASEGAYGANVADGKKPGDPKMFYAGIDGSVGVFELLKKGDTSYRASAALNLPAVGEGMVTLPDALWAGKTGDAIVPFELVKPGDTALIEKYLGFYGK